MLQLRENNQGEKHKFINDAVRESIRKNSVIEDINTSDDDINNIIKVDIASSRRDVDFILKILTGTDLLYVSRAIKQSKWLLNDELSHIINPEYVYKTLAPQMTCKAAYKLIKYIKLNLKNSERVEQFYEYNDLKNAADWLPHCSIDFIEANFHKHTDYVDMSLLRRLCEKSFNVLEIFAASDSFSKREGLQETIFLLKQDPVRYLNIVEKLPEYCCPNFNKTSTELIMKKIPQRVIKKYEFYNDYVDTSTFVKYLGKENIRKFLLDLYEENSNIRKSFYIKLSKITKFITAMPNKDRFEFVKQVFIEKVHQENDQLPKPLRYAMDSLYQHTVSERTIHKHYWYRFTPFDYAFNEVQKSISKDTPSDELCVMIKSLLISAGTNREYLLELLNYLRKNYSNSGKNIKQNVVQSITSECDFRKFDASLWKLFEAIFINDISISDDDYNTYIEPLIIYYTLHGIQLPDLVKQKFAFKTLKSYQNKLTKDEGDIVFNYLYNIIMKKINNSSASTENELKEKVMLLQTCLDTLSDWSKELSDYPILIDFLKEMLKIKEENSWNVDFSVIYTRKKSWRKLFFKESLKMNPNQAVFVNVLKHDPNLLLSGSKFGDSKYFDEIISPAIVLPQQIFLRKVKVYWYQEIANVLADRFRTNLTKTKNQNHATRALCLLLPIEELNKLLNEYAPKDIGDISEIDGVTLDIQRNFAKAMHISRPQPDPRIIMSYLNGGYLPYALPSLYAIFLNLNTIESHKHIPDLLNTRVSLQKHGIRLAFLKFNPEQINNILSEVLKINTNLSIRHVAFMLTHKLLCDQKEPTKILSTWQVLDSFLDNITFKENGDIYDKLFRVEDVPDLVKPNYYMKSYKFLKKLTDQDEQERYKSQFKNYFIGYACEIIESLCPKFVIEVLQDNLDSFINNKSYYTPLVDLISAYMLCAKTEVEQVQRYNDFLSPLIQTCLDRWNEVEDKTNYYVRVNFESLLKQLRNDLKKVVFAKKTIAPTELFKLIQTDLETLSAHENYLLQTEWQLTSLFANLVKSKHNQFTEWDNLTETICEEFARACNVLLEEHCNKYFEQIYVIFSKALYSVVKDLMSAMVTVKLCDHMIGGEHKLVYMAVLKFLGIYLYQYVPNEMKNELQKTCKVIGCNTSTEVQIHYSHFYKQCFREYVD